MTAAGRHKIIALTNNYARPGADSQIPPSELEFLGWDEGGATPQQLRSLFDDFCDSSVMGMRSILFLFCLSLYDHIYARTQETRT